MFVRIPGSGAVSHDRHLINISGWEQVEGEGRREERRQEGREAGRRKIGKKGKGRKYSLSLFWPLAWHFISRIKLSLSSDI